MNKYSRLIGNSAIFAIANFSSHLISFFFIRFYTEQLSREQYGILDAIITTVSLVIPIVTLAITEAVFRFSAGDKESDEPLRSGLMVSFIGSLLFSSVFFFIIQYTSYRIYYFYIISLVFLTSLDNIVSQHTRGIGKVALFATGGVLKTFVLTTSNIFFLAVLHWKVEGYLLSLILSEIATIFFLVFRLNIIHYIRWTINKKSFKEMLFYSMPLIPNVLSWWIMNAADKYEIVWLLGVSSNGIYAVSHKIPTIISSFNSIFFQAWQLSAIEEYYSEDKNRFYSNIFNIYAMLLFVLVAFLFVVLKGLMSVLVAKDFFDAWKFSPFLIIGAVFSAFSGFLGTNYVVTKKTIGASKTVILGAVVNVILNYVLIKFYNLNGAALATMISFAVTWIYRLFDTRSFINIEYRFVPLVLSILLLISQAVLMILDVPYTKFVGLVFLIIIVGLYHKEAFLMISLIKRAKRA